MDALRCSALAEAIGEPLAGTAATARSWLCLEQPGPWGRDALSASHLDEGVARELAGLAAGTGVRIVLIRRPGSHPDRHRPVPRHVYLAHTAPGNTWLERTMISDPKALFDLDFTRAAAGEPGQLGERVSDRLLLVCTNGRRDVCCALLGRPVAAALADLHGESVWECTHIGGHRFAPTAVLLPTGYAYGRLDVGSAGALLDGSPAVEPENCRGRSTWPPAGQVAELAVRARVGESGPDTLSVVDVGKAVGGGWLATVAHVDGREWRVAVAEKELGPARAASCTAAPTPAIGFEVLSVRETAICG
ncbi:MAG: sucrase ferredoxin [Actinophytocola sp.]|uniref:sucrase ferredoxin n=1 Tax=Actinophytocola sp. TaxID=1872138 RepID=UPI001329F19B|nr:sucrase ferredoxin [Actinophytocola sp.]MPZ80653.1 sucrase ferredoxin [Actinophytocola sp.]